MQGYEKKEFSKVMALYREGIEAGATKPVDCGPTVSSAGG
jgi:hypothetical protein